MICIQKIEETKGKAERAVVPSKEKVRIISTWTFDVVKSFLRYDYNDYSDCI